MIAEGCHPPGLISSERVQSHKFGQPHYKFSRPKKVENTTQLRRVTAARYYIPTALCSSAWRAARTFTHEKRTVRYPSRTNGTFRFRINSSTMRTEGRLSRRRSSSLSISSGSVVASDTAGLLAVFICDERGRTACSECARRGAVKRLLPRDCGHTHRNDYLIATGRNRRIALGNLPQPFDCEILNAEDGLAEGMAFDVDFVRGEDEVQRFGIRGKPREPCGAEVVVWEEVEFAVWEFDSGSRAG